MSETAASNTNQLGYAIWNTNLPDDAQPSGGILILADTGVTFQSLFKAVQQCFPRFQVVLTSQFPEEDEEPISPKIILIHASAFRNAAGIVARARTRFANTPIALLVDGAWADMPGLRSLVAERQVQGLLPFNMQINAWLATIWLLLNGGEYFPTPSRPRPGTNVNRPGSGHSSQSELEDAHAAGKLLSMREGEVLALLSEGLQNKLIAARMDLSEHTVKVHVHNIIRKLKVHNRTQAAAVYRTIGRYSGFGQMEDGTLTGWLESTGA